jgi:electron transfer flavoprotein-quinone oxidoreductase
VTATGLAAYRRHLDESFVVKDLRTYARAPKFLERERMYGAYGELAAGLFHDVFSLDGSPRKHLAAVARDALRRSSVSVRDLISDGWAGVRAL